MRATPLRPERTVMMIMMKVMMMVIAIIMMLVTSEKWVVRITRPMCMASTGRPLPGMGIPELIQQQ